MASGETERTPPRPTQDDREAVTSWEVQHAPVDRLLRDLRSRRDGLDSREVRRRLDAHGPNELHRRTARHWPRELAAQVTHPLAVLLWLAAALAGWADLWVLCWAIVAVVVVNALFAFVQEQQAERAVETLAHYLPEHTAALRDGVLQQVDAATLVPGDVIMVEEGHRVPADARLLEGAVEVDLSTLTGESQPAYRSVSLQDWSGPLLSARDLVFSGTGCTSGQATAVVFATGMRTEIGRIATLSQRVRRVPSPLETQVRRVARLIAVVAVAAGLAFLPLGIFLAGLPVTEAALFAVGLLVANVPEGLLPIITLALAVGVRTLARAGALIKRLSAVEVLGSTTVICTDKTGTLTENRMTATVIRTDAGEHRLERSDDKRVRQDPAARRLAETLAACNNAETADHDRPEHGDPTEIGLLHLAAALGQDTSVGERMRARRQHFHFDPGLKLMSTVDQSSESPVGLRVHTKGAPEAVLQRSTRILDADGLVRPLTEPQRHAIRQAAENYADQALRVLAAAYADPETSPTDHEARETLEQDLVFLGLLALTDPPRPEVAAAVSHCHTAGIRVIVVTGDHPMTARAIARQTGITRGDEHILTGADLAELRDPELDRTLREHPEIVFARTSPEDKLRITEALRSEGHVIAMTGDGVNDAPALHRADIGVAMGRSGTDVAREAATLVLTDDNFATIVAAVKAGRRVYDNIRKFIIYIFAHATPEVVPFLLFALSGGAIPLPLTVVQILAIDLGTETLPALALGREPAEPGLLHRKPRARTERIIRPRMLGRAWGLLGGISALLVLAAFFLPLLASGWTPGQPTGPGSPWHHTYLQATTMTFLGLVACQIGTAFASRSETTSLRKIGLTTNRLLLWGITFEIVFSLALVYLPPVATVFAMAPPEPWHLALLATFPPLVWAPDEVRKAWLRR